MTLKEESGGGTSSEQGKDARGRKHARASGGGGAGAAGRGARGGIRRGIDAARGATSNGSVAGKDGLSSGSERLVVLEGAVGVGGTDPIC